jgi:hypothetical protein
MTTVQGTIPAQVKTQAKFTPKATPTKSISLQTPPFAPLNSATEAILNYAFWLAEQKQQLSPPDYRKLLLEQGWQGEEQKYLQIASAFGKFLPQDVAQVEPRTIYRLAENSKKYQQVIDRLLDLSEITQATVRSLTKQQRHLTPKTSPQKPTIWRRTKNGGRYCQIPPIHEASYLTGTTLQTMMDEEGLSAQEIIAEAIALRKAYQEKNN